MQGRDVPVIDYDVISAPRIDGRLGMDAFCGLGIASEAHFQRGDHQDDFVEQTLVRSPELRRHLKKSGREEIGGSF